MKRKDALEMQERLFPRRQWLGVGPDGRPNGCVREIAPTLLEIAMDVRHAVNGHADSWPSDTLAEVREMLKARLVTWAASQDPFDELVRRLVVEAVSLIDGELSGGDSATYTHGAKTAGEVLKQLESCDGVRSDCVIIGRRQARFAPGARRGPAVKTCRHCARGRASRPRGLCWACYDATDVRGLYARRGYGVADFCGPARVAGEPTPHAPGTPGKLAALEGRAARGEALFRRDDADHGGLR